MKTNIKNIASKAFLVLGFLSFSLFASCSNDSNPEAVAEKFLNHVNKGEFAEAKEYCDEQTASLIGMMESMAAGKKEELKKNDGKIEIISSEIKDDKATVKYKTVGGKAPASDKEQSLSLVKVDGKWKVTINKEDANKEGGAKPEAAGSDSLDVQTDSLQTPADSVQTAE
ncbi:MAG TPA: DUF4878 domain-containing protein [Flavobacterium sp.]|nr:DUF4878 domain-containing protein [Flavobacterium sp.]